MLEIVVANLVMNIVLEVVLVQELITAFSVRLLETARIVHPVVLWVNTIKVEFVNLVIQHVLMDALDLLIP